MLTKVVEITSFDRATNLMAAEVKPPFRQGDTT
jgi:hypothetical protein